MKSLLDYEVISVIGSGSFATCFKIRDKSDNRIYAWKAITYNEVDNENDNESNKESFIFEINLLRQLKHPNIVQYYDHIINTKTKTIYIVMEYCEGGDLSKIIAKCRQENCQFEEKYIWKVLYQISKAVHVCHSSKILEGTVLHRDIKPANVFIDLQGNVKLGDFGLARLLKKHESYAESFVGTPYYMSPEIIKGDKYDKKSDIWSIGCLIYEMCVLKPPFRGHNLKQLSENISDGSFNRISENYSNDLQSMIKFLLNVDDEIRPSIEIIIRHPVLVYHASRIDEEFPKLVPAKKNDSGIVDKSKQKLNFSPSVSSNQNDLLTDTTIFTYTSALRTELFGSPEYQDNHKNKLLCNSITDTRNQINNQSQIDSLHPVDPDTLTRNIFDNALKSRLQAIRAQESLLNQKEKSLKEKEIELNKREKRLTALEKSLEQKKSKIESLLERSNLKSKRSKSCVPLARKPISSLDDTYCSIESNEITSCPTIAKLDLAVVPSLRPSLQRKVTFKSPKKFIKYDIENIPPISSIVNNNSKQTDDLKNSMKSSTSSKTSNDSDHTQKRRSIFSSIFGINNNKVKCNKNIEMNNVHPINNIVHEVEEKKLEKIWTSENKKVAFEMLAAMNTTSKEEKQNSLNNRRRSLDRKSRLRRSMAIAVDGRHQIFI